MNTKKAKKAQGLEGSIAESRAELIERILKKLNQGATFKEVCELYNVSHSQVRKYIATMHVHMTTEEAHYAREIAEHFGMLPNEAVSLFARERMEQAYKGESGVLPSKHAKKYKKDVLELVYERIMGRREKFELHVPTILAFNADKEAV